MSPTPVTKTAEDFRRAAHERQIVEWPSHECSICHYRCRWLSNLDGDAVAFDAGCYCSHRPPQPRTWADVADRYNMQRDARVIATMDAFWGFDPAGASADS